MTPARNRVTPTGDIEAIPLRCAWTGNRGIIHSGHEIVRFHASDLWITCALEFRGRTATSLGVDEPSAKLMNQQLHAERIVRGTHRRRLHPMSWAELPDGAFVLLGTTPAVVIADRLIEWTREGYRGRRARPTRGTADVVTPPSSVAALRAGYPVQIDASSRL